MTANPRSKVKQRLAAAGIAVGATVGSFAAASALSSTEESTTTTVAPEATGDDTTADDTTVEVDETRAAEEPLTGDLATQVTAAAEAALPGGTVERVETDADGATYEAHMTDADGNPVTVTFDENIDLVETITGAPGGPGDHRGPDGGPGGDRATEEPLTGDLATQVTAAAEAALPGGTVERVETDADGAAYEAHMTDADGNPVTVTFDENIDLVETITGAPGRPGDHGRGDHHDRDDDGALDEAMSTDTLTDG